MRIALGCDHRGLAFKQAIIKQVSDMGHSWEDFGCYDTDSVDYPDYAQKVAESVAKGDCAMGILICSTGIGMSIAANKVNKVRAALCHNPFTASKARLHNNANVLCMGEDVVEPQLREETVRTFLETKFEGGRHSGRIDKITALENTGK